MPLGTSKLRSFVQQLGDGEVVGLFRTDSTVQDIDACDGGATPTTEQDRPSWETTGERIEQDLMQAGGRVWQRDLSSSLDVSQATVSRWLCRLEEQGRVERVAVGREKLVVLPGYMPDAAASDHDQQPAGT